MCWSAEISISTFIIALAGTTIALINKLYTPLLVLFYLNFSSLQLVEYFLWTLKQPATRRVVCQIGFLLVLVQPLVIAIAIDPKTPTYRLWRNIFLYLWVATTIVWITWDPPVFEAHRGNNGHLVWSWISRNPAIITMWVIGLIGAMHTYRLSHGLNPWPATIFMIIAVAVSLWAYYKNNTWSSMWCWISNIIFVNIIIQVFVTEFTKCKSVL